jgi:large subunit ribosomal protein L15
VNIEVQWVLSELTIAAIEKNGGVITNKFYDRESVEAMANPLKFFAKGEPIPLNGTPPLNSLEFYTSAVNRGYLANPEQIRVERLKLAQKFGYELPDLVADPMREMLAKQKDPRQIWHGLEPGWVVNIKDKKVLKPVSQEWVDFYKS